ncbi:phosphotransferase [Pseudoalteromonas umbrosa]|uniref:phosphotransferase n=1 Tax=Pseudoalteromonas umbrosa TaxID=3048489 RepID=UPI0024C3C5D0|nr:phosphotransferase [Pseudoalteromonas sp. B95]MDK1285618.1 phosphotransferase [Pseudoalteromonas sp. B95]
MIDSNILAWLKDTLGNHDIALTTINGGANNQGYRVDSFNEQFFLKCFAPHEPRSLNKLQNEYVFTQHLNKTDIHNAAKPIACNNILKCALYTFIAGQPILVLKDYHIDAALEFIENVNDPNNIIDSLPEASESPETLYGFIEIIEKRLTRFNNLELDDNNQLHALLNSIRSRTQEIAQHATPIWHDKLPKTLLSPSDFGFHNAIEASTGIHFIDFEYAGRDNAWKLLSDFFAQPAIPVPISHITKFIASPIFSEINLRRQEFRTIYELTLMKWCLIMLNEFIPDIEKRRLFSWNNSCLESNNNLISEKKQSQLKKSVRYFANIPEKLNTLDRYL